MPTGALGWVMVAGGAALVAAGLWVLASTRRVPAEDAPRATPSRPTRFVLALGAMATGYHLVAYALDPSWVPLRVPEGRAWIVAAAVGVAVGASLALDRAEARRG